MLHKEFNNGLRAYPIHQADSTASLDRRQERTLVQPIQSSRLALLSADFHIVNITVNSTPKNVVFSMTAKRVKIEKGKNYRYRPAKGYIHILPECP